MKPVLSKSKFVGGWQCEKQVYLSANSPRLATRPDPASLAIMTAGTRVGELARNLWPDGVLVSISPFQHDRAVEVTQEFLLDDDIDVIFEAGFTALNVRIRADVMIRNGNGSTWDLVEIKSSSSVKPEHDVDMAIQKAVLEASGISVGKTQLVHINNSYIRGPGEVELRDLFKFVDRTGEVDSMMPEVMNLNEHLQQLIVAPEAPDINIGPHCEMPYKCNFFSHCSYGRPADWINYLPGFGLVKTAEFESNGVFKISEIPADQKLNEIQRRAVGASNGKTIWMSNDLGDRLSGLGRPLHFIDFETASSPIPLYAGTRPREVIAFQWSCHTLLENGDVNHSEFLAEGTVDPRREFVESLLRAVPPVGNVLVYSSYEEARLKELANLFPDLAAEINALKSRLIDLLKLVRENYYHPGFKGSFSIKRVLPVVVSGFDYSDLEIAEGSAASEAFVDIVEGRTDEADLDQIQSDLLDYCKRDTEAMVKIVQNLASIAESRRD